MDKNSVELMKVYMKRNGKKEQRDEILFVHKKPEIVLCIETIRK